MSVQTIIPTQGDGSFDTGSVLLDAGGGWTLLANLDLRGRPGPVIFDGVVSDASLTGLKVTQAARYHGSHRDVYTTWSAASQKVPVILPDANVATTSAGNWFQFEVESGGASEVAVWAKGAGAHVRLVGTAGYVESPQTLFDT